MASQIRDTAWLEWIASLMGTESRSTQTASLSPDLFHCLLDELPLHLIPRWHSGRREEALFLNPYCVILSSGDLPAELKRSVHLTEGFDLRGLVAWVLDPALRSLQPFWLGRELGNAVRDLLPGEAVPGSIPKAARNLLARAGIFLRKGEVEQRLAEWNEIVIKGAAQFCERGYVPIVNLIHPFNLGALRRYYRHAIRRGTVRLGDEQSSRRYVAHNERVARFLHHQITNAVSAMVGEPVKPSYVYMASYMGGADLKKHTDREQCEFSVTLCLDFSPEPELATTWPICLETADGTVTVYQALGDGLVYRGTRVPHYRKVLPEGCSSTSIFFHYVPANFSGSLD